MTYKLTDWECMGRKQVLPEPGECNWPDCGCDPHATKVIESLLEQGWAAPKQTALSAVSISPPDFSVSDLTPLYAAPAASCPEGTTSSQYTKTLENLVQCLIDNDPDEPIADNGMRVIDQWRDDAKRALSRKE